VLARRSAALIGTGGIALAWLLLAVGTPAASAAGPSAPPMGTAASYAVIAGTRVTSTGDTTIVGSLGVSPGTQAADVGVTGGAVEAGTAKALQAQSDLTTAYDDATLQPSTAPVPANPTGAILHAGVYATSSHVRLSGPLTLAGDAHDVFIFQVGAGLSVGSGGSVVLRGVRPCNVYWQVGGNAVLGGTFAGSVMAHGDITMRRGAALVGRALAGTGGEVSLNANRITGPGVCPAVRESASPLPTPTPTATPGVPSTATVAAAPIASAGPTSPVPAGHPETGEGGATGSVDTLLLLGGGLALGGAAWATTRAVRRPRASRSHR
jgi:hypothetical protein